MSGNFFPPFLKSIPSKPSADGFDFSKPYAEGTKLELFEPVFEVVHLLSETWLGLIGQKLGVKKPRPFVVWGRYLFSVVLAVYSSFCLTVSLLYLCSYHSCTLPFVLGPMRPFLFNFFLLLHMFTVNTFFSYKELGIRDNLKPFRFKGNKNFACHIAAKNVVCKKSSLSKGANIFLVFWRVTVASIRCCVVALSFVAT